MYTVSGIVTLCKLPYCALFEITVWQLTERDDCIHTIFFPPEDEHNDAQNMSSSIV